MYDRVIWPENYDPKTSAIYALNDIDVKPPISTPRYLIHFAGAKQSGTRPARIEKAMSAIFEGRGFQERR